MIYKSFGIYLLFLIASCTSKSNNESHGRNLELYSNGNIKSEWVVVNGLKEGIQISYYESGVVKSMFNYHKGEKIGDQLWFHENGMLSQKVNFKNGVANGMAYYFFPSGNLKSDRFYNNDIVNGIGADYWDEEFGVLKSTLHFNDSGHIYYKKIFDTTGIFIAEEGKKPDYIK